MRTAKDFPIKHPYGATYSPWSVKRPHLGEDRPMPLGTPIEVNGVLVGYAGTTGLSTGVHTHTQRVYGGAVIHPQGGGFDVPQPTVVTETGYKRDSIGYYVRYKDGQGFEWSIFHMDSPAIVRVGQQLINEEEAVVTFEELQQLSQTVLGRKEPITRQWYDSNPPERSMTFKQVHDTWASSEEAKNFRFKAWDYDRLVSDSGYVQITEPIFRKKG